MIEVTAAIENNGLDGDGLGALCDELPDLERSFRVGLGSLDRFILGAGGSDGLAADVIDQLGVDVFVGEMDGETGALCGAGHFAADACVNTAPGFFAINLHDLK